MNGEKVIKLLWSVFTTIGAIFVIIGLIVFFCVCNNYKNKVDTVGIITDTGNGTTVSYNVEGEEHESSFSGYSSDFHVGDEIEIYYDKEDVNKIGSKLLDLLYLILPGIGSIFLLIGVIGLAYISHKKKKEKWLRENGELVYATYSETIINRNIAVNRRNPYNVIVQWNNPEDGKKYLLRSKNIYFNPERLIEERNIKMFPVYINPNKKKQYFVDVDILNEDVVDLT